MNDSRMSGLGASPSQYFARQRIESLVNVPRLFAAIDTDPGIVGAGVVYIDADYNVVTLREFRPICSVLPKRVVLQEVKRYLTPEQYVEQVMEAPRDSRLWGEIANLGLACASAIFNLAAIMTGGLFTMFSGPVGLMILYAGVAGTAASGLLCINSVFRTGQELIDPEVLDRLDEKIWYRSITELLDGVSLLGTAGTTATAVKFVQVRKATTGASWFDITRTLSRQQRKALTKELLLIKHPSLTAKQLKLQQQLGAISKRYTPTQIKQGTTALIRESIGGVLGVGGSSAVQSVALSLVEGSES
ncbi:NAD synthetase [Pseudomonas sp. BIGb0427]|uniref:NAD synthetase n=1 Tax=unclassified Pseudomonas TaxID=196821 RepID=UPI0018A73EB1|nr:MULTISPECIES: NAD synthetase [unclassified Pseudomonas]QPG62654.1 NAD synthetase [Pseudomonas sp. BIGb0427]UVM65001.1 NAD synthetase [Pseudomonas sp. B21-009]